MSCSREEVNREDGARHRLPSPIAVMCFASPFLPHTLSVFPSPFHLAVGVYKLGVCHIISTELAHVVWRNEFEGGVAADVQCWVGYNSVCVSGSWANSEMRRRHKDLFYWNISLFSCQKERKKHLQLWQNDRNT